MYYADDRMKVISEGLRIVEKVATKNSAPLVTVKSDSWAKKEYHDEEVVAGEILENYLRRVPNEDGTHVVVTKHAEWIEKVRQPLTPEEIAQQKVGRDLERKGRLKLASIIVGGAVACVGIISLWDYKSGQKIARSIQQTSGV